MLEEVVVVGYGTMRKKDLTGAVSQINPDKLADQNPGTVQNLLRGTAGLDVGISNDAKGGGSLQLRGQNSVYTGGNHNSPLIILDGMDFYGELSEINPADIAQIDVLKDASAAAVYGARAASGVIIVTTKKGKLGKPTINFGVNLGISTKAKNAKCGVPAIICVSVRTILKPELLATMRNRAPMVIIMAVATAICRDTTTIGTTLANTE